MARFIGIDALPSSNQKTIQRHDFRGIDRALLESMLLYNRQSKVFIYTDMTPVKAAWRAAMRLALEQVVAKICPDTISSRDRVLYSSRPPGFYRDESAGLRCCCILKTDTRPAGIFQSFSSVQAAELP
ncbi:MAG: hypothetical protein ABIG61_14415 [Planctomycetota bacterium]